MSNSYFYVNFGCICTREICSGSLIEIGIAFVSVFAVWKFKIWSWKCEKWIDRPRTCAAVYSSAHGMWSNSNVTHFDQIFNIMLKKLFIAVLKVKVDHFKKWWIELLSGFQKFRTIQCMFLYGQFLLFVDFHILLSISLHITLARFKKLWKNMAFFIKLELYSRKLM